MTEVKDAKVTAKFDISQYSKFMQLVYEIRESEAARRAIVEFALYTDVERDFKIILRDGYVIENAGEKGITLSYCHRQITGNDPVFAILSSYTANTSIEMEQLLSDIYAVLPGTKNRLLLEHMKSSAGKVGTATPAVKITDQPPPPYTPGG